MSVKFSNNATTTLASSATSSATSITVADGSVFPTLNASDYFYLTLETVANTAREIVKCTAKNGNILTVVRAQDSTSASAFSVADKVELRLTAAGLNDVASQADTDTNTTYSIQDGELSQNNFTDADHSKLDGIEASADVTDTTNVTASGALMDSELTAIASVKALNQGVATTNSPAFANLTLTGTDSVKVPNGTTAQRNGSPANGMFRYNSTTAEFEGYQAGAWGSIGGGAADLTLNSFTGDGSDLTFSLSSATLENNTLVYIDGVYQNKSTYAVSAATPAVVTFSEAPSNGAAIEIMVAAISATDIGTPSDNTVTTAKVVDGAVTTAKILDANVTTSKIVDGSITSAKLGAGVGGAFNDFSIKTTAYTAVTRDQLIVNSSSAVTITLPASPSAGNVVFIKNAGSGTVTVARNGSNINSTADDGSLAADAGASLVFCNSTIGWKEI